MLLTIHNLPKDVRSSDVKQLIQERSGLREVILDNLRNEGVGKRITVGLAEEEDAAILMRNINGILYKNCTLYVEDVRQKKLTTQSYQTTIPAGLQPPVSTPLIQNPLQAQQNMMAMNYSNMPYYMTQNVNTIMNQGKINDTQLNSNKQPNYQNTSSTYQALSQLGYPFNILYPTKVQDPSTVNTQQNFGSYQNDRDNRGDRRNDAQTNWRENKSPPSKRHDNFGNFSQHKSTYQDKRNSEWGGQNKRLRQDRGDDRSPPRGRDRDTSNDRRGFDQSRRSRSNRSNPRDRDSYYEQQSDREQDAYDHRGQEAYDHRDRQGEREFVQHKPRNYLKRQSEQNRGNNFWSRRPTETSTSFSSNPGNSTFTKSNRSILEKVTDTFDYGGQTSYNKVEFNPFNQISQPQDNLPPAKKPRFDQNVNNLPRFGNKNFTNPNAVSIEVDAKKMMMRYTNWRTQSATLLAKEVIKNGSTSMLDNIRFKNVLKKLKECINSRLDVILGDRIATSLDEIMRGYRMKFNEKDDIGFFKAIMEKVEREIREKADASANINVNKEHQGVSKEQKLQNAPDQFTENKNENPKKTPGAQDTLPSQNQSVKKSSPHMDTKKLPKNPNTDKKEYRKIKKNELLEYQEDFYKMEPALQKAVDEEIEQLVQCYINACEPSNDEDEEMVRNTILTNTVDEFKKVIKLQVTKRVLNITDGLCVRIFPSSKQPPKGVLDAFLQRHGVIRWKKSNTSKIFIAQCNSYQNYDKLLALQTATFGNNMSIQIKPLHLTGPPEKKLKTANAKAKGNKTDDFKIDIDEIDLELEELIDVIDDLNESDVVLVENEQNVVVIHDESFNLGEKSDDNTEGIQDLNPDSSINKVLQEDSIESNKDGNPADEENVISQDTLKLDTDKDSGNTQTEIKDSPTNNNEGNSFQVKDSITHSDNKDVKNSQNNITDSIVVNSNIENTGTKDTLHKHDNIQDINSTSTGVAEIDKEIQQINVEIDSESIDHILNSVDGIIEDDLEDF